MKIIITFCLLLLLSACGFHVRGTEPVPPALKTMYVQSVHPFDRFTKKLKASLGQVGVNVLSKPEHAPFILNISSINLATATSSISASNTVSEVVLTYTVNFDLENQKGKIIVPTTAVTSTTNFVSNTNQLLGSYARIVKMCRAARANT